MLFPRSSHSLTVLADGTVLAAGGCANAWGSFDPHVECSPRESAELFDPISGTWTATGSMTSARAFHGAALLHDGRVLVAGGWSALSCFENGQSAMADAEIYDPSTGRWSPAGRMATGRAASWHDLSLVVLPSGKVLFPGGIDVDPATGATELASAAELFDPATGAWTRTGPMVTRRSNPTALGLPSGKVLVVGGMATLHVGSCSFQDSSMRGFTFPGTETAELYDPDTDAWTPTGSLERPVEWNTLTLLPTGEVLLTGGQSTFTAAADGSNPSDQASLYDPATGTWRSARPMLHRRGYAQAVPLESGRVLVVGGNWTIDGGRRGDLYPAFEPEAYDPWLDTWTSMPVLRHYVLGFGAAVHLPSGGALFTGGLVDDLAVLEFIEGWSAFPITASQRFHEALWEGAP